MPAGFFPSNVVLDEDGGVLTLGGDFSIIRHLEDGTLDASFGGDGRSDAPTPPANFILTAMFEATRQSDGKIVAIGWAVRNGDFNHQFVAAARYHADGTVDTDFGTDGLALLEATWPSLSCSSNDPNTRLRPNQLVIQPDGKILIAGSHHWCGSTKVAAMRRLPDGTWDPGFGTNGLSNTAGIGGRGEGLSVWLEDGGGFTVAGSGIYGFAAGIGGVMHRYLDNGTLDTTFGDGDGRVEVGQGLIEPQAVGRDLDGSYYFAGNETSGSTARLVVLRANAEVAMTRRSAPTAGCSRWSDPSVATALARSSTSAPEPSGSPATPASARSETSQPSTASTDVHRRGRQRRAGGGVHRRLHNRPAVSLLCRLAEREGFEPPSLAAGRFQGGCIRPLCHRSGIEDTGLHSGAPRRGARAAEWGALLRR